MRPDEVLTIVTNLREARPSAADVLVVLLPGSDRGPVVPGSDTVPPCRIDRP